MRVFQCSDSLPSYAKRLRSLTIHRSDFAGKVAAFHSDRFEAVHTLAPVLEGSPDAFYTHGNNLEWQRAWAKENGLPSSVSLEEILLAQIEDHRTEVFYANGAGAPESRLLRRFPGHVRSRICFFAGPSLDRDLSGYLVVNNFPSLLKRYSEKGLRTAYLAPSHDPILDEFASNTVRDIDVLFVGTFSRHHLRRTAILESVARGVQSSAIVYSILPGRLSRLADTPLGLIGPLRRHRRPASIREISVPAVFGLDYYRLLSRAKIVLNAAVDISGPDRGNMRCWEALGAACLMVSDDGNYPSGMLDGVTIRTYKSANDVASCISAMLANAEAMNTIARAGHEMLRSEYSKSRQWQALTALVG